MMCLKKTQLLHIGDEKGKGLADPESLRTPL